MPVTSIEKGYEGMRKRLRKKIAKEKCLKCGDGSGVCSWRKLKTGRYVSSRVYCFNCDGEET